MESTKEKVTGLWKKYWDVNAGLSHPSKGLKRIAKLFYYIYLVLGIVGAAACLISFFRALFDWGEFQIMPLLMVVITPLLCKFLGWLSTLSLAAVAVVVESHEKHLEEYNKADAK